jgi:hypothetical protein
MGSSGFQPVTMNQNTPSPVPIASTPPQRLSAFLEDLAWPLLFRAFPLALRPNRLGLSLLTLVLLALVGNVNQLWGADDEPGVITTLWESVTSGLASIISGISSAVVLDLDGALPAISGGFESIFIGAPGTMTEAHGIVWIPILLLMLLAWVTLGCAISRSVAFDLAKSDPLPWPRAIGFALQRWRSLLVGVLTPLAIIGFLLLLIWIGGLLLRVPVLNWVIGVIFFLDLIFGLIAAWLAVCYVFGGPLIVPSISCDGADGIDAIQRSYARVIGQPGRLLAYFAVAIICGALSWVAVEAVVHFTGSMISAVSGQRGADAWRLAQGLPLAVETPPVEAAEDEPAGPGAPVRMLAFWFSLLMLLTPAFLVSFWHAATTILHLILRRASDGQDVADIWIPGLIEGAMVESMRARAQAHREESQGDNQ